MTQKNNTETAALYIEQAITNLRDLDANETPANFWDWVYVAEQALEHAPQCMSSLIENCFQYLAKIEGSTPNPARHRFRTIYLNRLAALALAKQGQLEQAIKIGRDCCYYINIENEDDVAHDLTFIAHWISWLEQTQQFEELATFALACAFHCRPKALQTAYHMALSYVDLDTPQKERWALILAWAALSDEAQQYVDKPTQPAAYYLAMVASDSVYQPFIALMQGVCLTPEQQNETQILELLERGINHFPGFADNEVLLKLWGLRFQLYGDQALTLPYPPCSGGNWTYNLATVFNHIDRHSGNFSPYMTDLDQLPSQEQLNDLAKYYFESGLKCFENFWATGKGNYPDGYVHSYSMLCNNYSGLLRDSYNNYDLAIEIHHKGFAASPFSEHLYGLLLCHIQRQDHAAIAHSAEKLWHYALEHGFSRHDPRYYLTEVSSALMELDRSSEIAIWLERLEQWWQTLIQNEDEDIDSTEQTLVQNGDTDPTDPAEIIDYYYSILPMLDKLAPAQPEAVLHRLREHSTGIRHTGDTGLLRCLGVIFLELQYYKEAMFYFEEAIAHIDDNTDPYDIEHAPQGLQACKEALNLIPTEEVSADNVATTTKKPWWKVW